MDWNLGISFARKDKYRILYLKTVSGIPSVRYKRDISPNVVQAGLKGKPFDFDIKRPAYRIKNRFIYFVDVDIGQLFLYEEKSTVSPQLRNSIKREVVKQLVSGLENPPLFQNLALLLLCLGFGVVCGYILGLAFPI